jgi:acetyltransferase-like isoleucine patch superfamily enzyme
MSKSGRRKILRKLFEKAKIIFELNLLRWRKLRLYGVDFQRDIRIHGRVTVVGNKNNIKIGKNCSLNEGVLLNGLNKIVIGDNTILSSNVLVHTGYLSVDRLPRKHDSNPIVIGNNVWIASAVVITAGVTINDNVVIGANSTVTKDLEAGFFYAGSPCKKIKKIEYKE